MLIFFAVKAKKWYSGDGKPADIGGYGLKPGSLIQRSLHKGL